MMETDCMYGMSRATEHSERAQGCTAAGVDVNLIFLASCNAGCQDLALTAFLI